MICNLHYDPRTHSSYLVWLIFCLNFGTGQWKPRKSDHRVSFLSVTHLHWHSIAGLEVYPWKQMISNISEINFEIYIIISLGKMGMRSESRKKQSHSMSKARRDSWWADRKEVDGGDTCICIATTNQESLSWCSWSGIKDSMSAEGRS